MKLMFSWTRAQIILGLGAFLLTVLSSLPFNLLVPSQAQSQEVKDLPLQEIVQGWQYHWGDFPLDDNGVPIWTQEEISQLNWQPFQFPQRLLRQQGQKIVWLRVSLPPGQWKSPNLYLRAVPHILNTYLDKKPIYRQLSLNSAGEAEFEDYQLPIVPLEPGFSGKSLLFRVYVGKASSIYIGLFDRVAIGSQIALVKRLLQPVVDTVLGIFFALLGLIAILLSFRRQERKAYLYFGLLSLLISLYTIFRAASIAFLLKSFEISNYFEYVSLYLIPVIACLFFEEIFGAGYQSIVRRLWQIHLAYTIIALSLVTSAAVSWSSTVYPAQVLLLASALIILFTAIKISLQGNYDAKLFMLGFIVLAVSVINDVLIYQLKSTYFWYQKLYPWGTFAFILILGFILERRFAESRQLLQHYAKELESKNVALQKINQLKDEFLANTSHELRTPLNGIIGIAESLVDGATGKLSMQTMANLSLIVSEGRRLNQLVNDLLDFSQLKHKRVELKKKPVGIRELTDIVLVLAQPLVGKKKLQLINKIAFDIPPADADENRLQQILSNLVGNAIKFTESGTVEVSAVVVEDELEITVADTGIGIPADKFDRIFESFEQADGAINREYGGVGLGLAVTKQLVQLHGSNIRVESTVGVGSRFTFTLSISKGKVENKQREEVSKLTSPTAMTLNTDALLVDGEVSVPIEGACHILIVDDEPVNLQVLANLLSLQNYAIAQASDGIEALEIIRQGFKPDLILLDIMMPKMTGYELCKKIREQFQAHELPVVLLTAKNQVTDLVEGFSAGANDYLTKPVWKNELLARIKTHIRLSKINIAYGRFVPHEFLQFLERESIVDVQLGDQVQKEMSVLFADIRSFTSLSEKMSPKENFDFLNAYLRRVSPVIRNHNGFIDKYIGDAVMALFPKAADDAVQAAIEMQKQVSLYNGYRQETNEDPIAIGIGIHTGSLMLGTVGEPQRMEGTVIADAVNLASRLESLTKIYGVDILVSEQTLHVLNNSKDYSYRFLGRFKVKGKSLPVDVFEVFDGDPDYLIELKRQTRDVFEHAVALFVEEKFAQAQQVFQQVLLLNEQDRATQLYLERCKKAQRFEVSERNVVIG